MSEALIDTRQPGKVRHSVEDLLRQRIYQICCGYEDVTYANALRFDPGLQTALRRVAGVPDATLASTGSFIPDYPWPRAIALAIPSKIMAWRGARAHQ